MLKCNNDNKCEFHYRITALKTFIHSTFNIHSFDIKTYILPLLR